MLLSDKLHQAHLEGLKKMQEEAQDPHLKLALEQEHNRVQQALSKPGGPPQ